MSLPKIFSSFFEHKFQINTLRNLINNSSSDGNEKDLEAWISFPFDDPTLAKDLIGNTSHDIVLNIVRGYEKFVTGINSDQYVEAATRILFPEIEGAEVQMADLAVDQWSIISTYHGDGFTLALCHYKKSFDLTRLSTSFLTRVKGVIVDVQNGNVVSSMGGYVEEMPAHSELFETEDGLIGVDTFVKNWSTTASTGESDQCYIGNGVHTFSKDVKFYPDYEPVSTRFFKYRGIVFFGTFRLIDASEMKSWGNRATYAEVLEDLDISHYLTGDGLFGDEWTSPFTHTFLLSHPSTRMASSYRGSLVVSIGVSDVGTSATDSDGLDLEKTPLFIPRRTFKGLEKPDDVNLGLKKTEEISVGIVNAILYPEERESMESQTRGTEIKDAGFEHNEMHLLYEDDKVVGVQYSKSGGYSSDTRMMAGDSVIAIDFDPRLNTYVTYKLTSDAYRFRSEYLERKQVSTTIKIHQGHDSELYHNLVINVQAMVMMHPRDIRGRFPVVFTDVETSHDGVQSRPIDTRTVQGKRAIASYLFSSAVCPLFTNSISFRVVGNEARLATGGGVSSFMTRFVKQMNFLPTFITSYTPQADDNLSNQMQMRISYLKGNPQHVVSESGNSVYRMIRLMTKKH